MYLLSQIQKEYIRFAAKENLHVGFFTKYLKRIKYPIVIELRTKFCMLYDTENI